jgi:hypothetical protein
MSSELEDISQEVEKIQRYWRVPRTMRKRSSSALQRRGRKTFITSIRVTRINLAGNTSPSS